MVARMSREWWDREAREDWRYKTLLWGGDGTPEDIFPTIQAELANIDKVIGWVPERDRPLGILEIGCGPGRLLRRLAARHPDDVFYGIDISPEMLALAGEWPPNVSVFTTDENLSGLFDVIYSIEVFQHLTHEEKFGYLEDIRAMLAKGGLGLVQVVIGDDTDLPANHPISARELLDMTNVAGLKPIVVPGIQTVHDEWGWMVLT